MKLATVIIFAVTALVPIFSAIAQEDEEFAGVAEDFGRGEEEIVGGKEESGADDEDVPVEGRILGAAPAFGLGLLGGHIGSSLVRNVGSLLGLRQPSLPPFVRSPPAAYYPAPYVPAGFPYPSYPAAFPGRTASGKGLPGPRVPSGSFVPAAIPFAPAIPIEYYRTNTEDDEQDEAVDENETY